MNFTKAITEVSVSEGEYKDFVKNNINDTEEIEEYLLRIKEDIKFKLFNENSKLKIEIDKLLKNNFVYIKNKDVYYCKDLNGLFPNFEKFQFGKDDTYYAFSEDSSKLNFNAYKGSYINEKEADYLYKIWKKCKDVNNKIDAKDKDINKKLILMNLSMPITYYDYDTKGKKFSYITSNGYKYNFDRYREGYSSLVPVYRLENNKQALFTLIKENLMPQGLSIETEKIYSEILNLYKQKLLLLNDDLLDIDLLKILFNNGFEYESSNGILNIKNLEKEVIDKKNVVTSVDSLKSKFLNCEKLRADIEPYDEKILQDPNRGHWDLWINEVNENDYKFTFDKELIARNPIADIKQDGIIGIDFGTKSTVVVYMEGREYIMPMRIGMGNYTSEISSNQYENPTVMQFRDLEEFLKDYNEKDGRPDTKWEDLTISHTAYNSLINSSSDKYYSFLGDLKQWAGSSKDNIRIRDEKTFNEILKPYIELDEESLDPIELYAYYLGLYINNMRNGIYLNYILSFPVTYEKAIREKMISSFEKGIKKSLPETIIDNDEIMNKFKVSFSTSEPAAYSISALTEYNIEPDENPVFYGVFDFGGGTTDFDFGIYKESEERDRRRFDYIIEHFGAGGDRTLGGENLLELLSFEIFKNNQKLLREKLIV